MLATLDLTYLSPITSIGRPENSVAGAVESEEEAGVRKKETAFDQLVLPPGHKKMVLSLIAQHYRDKESGTADTEQVDIVRGKGTLCPAVPPSSAQEANFYLPP